MSTHARGFDRGYARKTLTSYLDDVDDRQYKFQRRMQRRRFLHRLYNQHVVRTFQLFRGDDKFPRTLRMTGAEARAKNRDLRVAFLKRHINGDDQTRLWSWRGIDMTRDAWHAHKQRYMDRFDAAITPKKEILAWLAQEGLEIK